MNLLVFILAILSLGLNMPRDFSSLDELTTFIQEDKSNEVLYLTASENGTIDLTGVCEHYAFQLRDNALKLGYRIETEIQTCEETGTTPHMLNKAIIGNNIYFIDPSTDKIWLAYYLD